MFRLLSFSLVSTKCCPPVVPTPALFLRQTCIAHNKFNCSFRIWYISISFQYKSISNRICCSELSICSSYNFEFVEVVTVPARLFLKYLEQLNYMHQQMQVALIARVPAFQLISLVASATYLLCFAYAWYSVPSVIPEMSAPLVLLKVTF